MLKAAYYADGKWDKEVNTFLTAFGKRVRRDQKLAPILSVFLEDLFNPKQESARFSQENWERTKVWLRSQGIR